MPKQDPKSLFMKALEQDSPEDLASFLDEKCGADTTLRATVEELLKAHDDAGNFLGGIDDSTSVSNLEKEKTSALVGTQIGPYKVLQEIGEGGFGVVYMAEQTQPVDRKVALKIIKPGMDSREIIARFEAERQALAMMDHPNIARVLDAGQTELGHPYFAMELVHGVPITEYADRNRLSMQDRLQIFMTVCRAVQHAHHKGIIHRDIKPTNVMVTLHDGQPVVKVIDFGVAKALNQKLTEKTLFTSYGQMIGTPQYMSPEQAEMSGLDIDTRSDVYSLGVLLYELLTGSTPLTEESVREASYAEIQRLVREQDAPRLGARLSTLGEKLTAVAQHRNIEPKRLQRTVQGDLDWIVLRALEKERGRRYETPAAFVADIKRYVTNEPVEACPPSTAYRLKKFISRNRGWFSGVSAVLLALLIGLGVATYAFFLAQKRKQIAEKESVRANEVVRVLNEMLESADPTSGTQNYTVREMLDEFAATLDGRFSNPQVEASVRHTVGRAYYHLGLYRAAEPQLRQALKLTRTAERGTREEAVLLTHLAEAIKANTFVFDEPKKLLREAVEVLKKRGDSPKELANTYAILAWTLYNDGNNPDLQLQPSENEGVLLNREASRLIEPFTDSQSNLLKGRLCVGLAFELACSSERKDIRAAKAYAEQAMEYLRATPNALFNSMAYASHGLCEMKLGKPASAEASYRKAVELETQRRSAPDSTLYQCVMAMFQQGKFDEAIQFGLELTEPDNWPEPLPASCVKGRTSMANVLLALGDLERAEQILRETTELSNARLGPDNSRTIEARYFLGLALVSQRRNSDRRAEGQAILASLLPVGRILAQTGRADLSTAFAYVVGNIKSPDKEDVEAALRANRKILELPLIPARRLRGLYAEGLLHQQAGNVADAKKRCREIIAAAHTWSPSYAYSPFLVLRNAEDALAELWTESDDTVQAELVYREAIANRQNARRSDKYQIIFAQVRLAEFLLAHDKRREALEILDSSFGDLKDCPNCFDWLKQRVERLK